MSALTFDTHAVIKDLTDAGPAPPEHAEAVTKAIKTAQDTHLEDSATKGDHSSGGQRRDR